MKFRVIVIGGGPAGISASIQLKRHNIESVLFEKDELGGLCKCAHWIENYPGFPNGISGTELVERLKKQVISSNIKVLFEKVETLTFIEDQKMFSVQTNNDVYYSHFVVVASGTEPKKDMLMDLIPIDLHQNVIFNIHSILKKEKKKIVVLGAGDIAFDYALSLSKSNEVFILNRSNRICALPILKERIKNNSNIHYIGHSVIKNVEGGKKKELLVSFENNGVCRKIEADYMVFAIGRIPQQDFYTPELVKKEQWLISQGLLYLTGDVKNGNFRQIAISVGNGIEVAMKINNRIRKNQNEGYC